MIIVAIEKRIVMIESETVQFIFVFDGKGPHT